MIVLDTNQLEHAQPPDGALLTMLTTIANSAGMELCLPELVLEEHLAHYRHDVEDANRELAKAAATLRHLIPHWPGKISAVGIDSAVQERTRRLQEVFRILPTPDGACREGMLRETRRHPPARTSWDGPGAGGRDVAIWLTAVEACRTALSAVYFVSADKAAFGVQQRDVLATELTERLEPTDAEYFRFCTGVDDLLSQLASEQPHNLSRAALTAAAPVREAVEAAMTGSEVFFELVSSFDMGNTVVSSEGPVRDLKLDKLNKTAGGKDVVAYEVYGVTWACARPTWRAVRDFAFRLTGASSEAAAIKHVTVTFAMNTTLVMKLDQDGAVVDAEVAARGRCVDITGTVTG
ncbi:PIN domain-containing protein [Yinghuangia aomiensis]